MGKGYRSGIVKKLSRRTDASFVRFGDSSPEEESVVWLKLSSEMESKIAAEMSRNGLTPRQAMEKLGISIKGKFESGVSSFNVDSKDGLPRLDTASQLRTFFISSIKSDQSLYSFDGDLIGTGIDGEPLIRNIKNKKPYKLRDIDITRVYEKTLRNNFGKRTKMTQTELQMFPHHKERPMSSAGYNDYSVLYYRGYKYEQPKESFGATITVHKRKKIRG